MGKNNKARRAAKAKARQRSRPRPEERRSSDNRHADQPEDGFGFSRDEAATLLWVRAAQSRRRGNVRDEMLWRRLLELPAALSVRTAEALLLEHVDLLYANGWQPAELLRQGRLNGLGAASGRLVARALAADDANRRATTLDAAWIAQVSSLGLPGDNGSPGWIHRWLTEESLGHAEALETVLDTYAGILRLPPLQKLMPSPGPPGGRPHPAPVSGRRATVADPVLTRVRNLLAKAESSTYEAEAISFTAKAQELITRHAIDVALLEEDTPTDAVPVETRTPIDAPYADAKSLLLQTVAETGRCQAIFQPSVQMSTLVGFPDDVEAVDMLFTSLLVQAQRAMNQAARSAPSGARTRSQSYRSSFLLAYTQRIGDRLRATNRDAVDEATRTTGRSVLPVLADRSSRVTDYVSERFGELEGGAVRRGYDPAGWAGGRMAADAAQLGFEELIEGFDDIAR